MKELRTIQVEIQTYSQREDLTDEDNMLLSKAEEARAQAYAPYSKFKVGAAVLLANDILVTGNNQENAAYPSGLCAERVAVYAASAQYPDVVIKKIAITAQASDYTIMQPVAPCGACRQALLEYELKQAEAINILLYGEKGAVYRIQGIKQLLPLFFGQDFLTGGI